ncbi:MAG: hypothetical protein QOJ64_1541 [Acidobacteriota bacterium]|jgi:uncharacterized membrane protein YagU involved in acid resistance|nr:hypothetical protein [Acidobacteriota bacterium]
MNATALSSSANTTRAYKAILWAGLIAGTLDITGAIVISAFRGTMPIKVLQSVASGLLGAASYEGGLTTALLGLGLHFVIATGAATVFCFASTIFRFLVRQPIISGVIYGIAVYLFMNFVVLPLSPFPQGAPVPISRRIIGLLVIIFCVGLPISLIVRQFSKERSRTLPLPL